MSFLRFFSVAFGLCVAAVSLTHAQQADVSGDTTPPVVSCLVGTPVIWSTDHKFTDVGLSVTVHDNQDSAPRVDVQVYSNEDDDETGNGNFSPDARIVPPQLLLRAERSSSGSGRVYLVVVTATDRSGNAAKATCTAVVPLNQSDAALAQVRQLATQASGATPPPAGYFLVGDGPDRSSFRVAIAAPADGASFRWGQLVSLSATTTLPATKVEYYDGFAKIGESLTAPFSVNYTNVGTGFHVIEAVATDGNGVRYSSNPITFTQQANVPPVVQITVPTSGKVIQPNEAVAVSATASDSDGSVARVELFAAGNKVAEKTVAPYSFAWSSGFPGNYNLIAVATDNAGARTLSAAVPVVVNSPPAISLITPSNKAVIQVGQQVALSAAATDSDGTIQKVEFFAGASKLAERTQSPFTATWDGAAAGNYNLTAVATDNTGAQTVSAPVVLTINAAPTAMVVGPSSGTVAQPSQPVAVTATASDADGAVTKLELFADDSKIAESSSGSLNFSWTPNSGGQHSLRARATDNNGGIGNSPVVSVRVNALPNIALIAPVDGSVLQANNATLIAAATDSDGTVAKVEFFEGSNKIGEATAAPYSIAWPNPSPATYTIAVKATDDSGGTTTSTPVTIRVNAPPAVAMTGPSPNGEFSTGDSISLTANATDPDDRVAKVEFFVGTVKVGEALTPPYASTWSPDTEGDFTLTARATDGSGASTTSVPVGVKIHVPLASPDLSSGYFSATLALKPDGKLWTWGAMAGDGSARTHSYPTQLATPSGITAVSAGGQHAALLRRDGTIWTWGVNGNGQLGDGTTTDRKISQIVPQVTNAAAVKAGGAHTLALLFDGTVLSWGENSYGQLGTGDTAQSASPVAIPGLGGVRKLAAGDQRSIALKTDGSVWSWGYEYYAWQSGVDVYHMVPTQVDGLSDVVDVAAAVEHAVAVKSDGTVWAWGANWENEIGTRVPGVIQATPIQVPGLSSIVEVSSTYEHTLALKSDGTVWAWGSNQNGELGSGVTSSSGTPVQVKGLTDVIAIAAGQWYSMAMKSDGTIWGWGQLSAALGLPYDGTSTLTPRQVVTGLLDQNSNGMDDRWEIDLCGNLTQSANGDYDGDGITNLQEYLGHSDPSDFYNGSAPSLSLISGGDQIGDPDAVLVNPIMLQVTSSDGRPLANAPISLTADNGSFATSNDPAAPLSWSLTVRTNANGVAQVYFHSPALVGTTSTISASAGAAKTVTILERTNTPPPPEAPSDVTATRQPDASTVVKWVSHSTNEAGFAIKRQNLDRSWQTLSTVGPGVTATTIPPNQYQPVADTRDYQVAAYDSFGQEAASPETNPAVVRYAVIDLGPNAKPVRVTNSGYVLSLAAYPFNGPRRWFQGAFEELTGGDEPLLAGAMDIDEDGTAVGSILRYQPGSAPTYGAADNCSDSQWSWYRRLDYGVRIAAAWTAGQTGASPIGQPTFAFNVHDCTNAQDAPYTGSATFGSASIIDNGHVYGQAMVGYAEHQSTMDGSDPLYYYPTRWGAMYSGYDFTGGTIFGDQQLVYHPEALYDNAGNRYIDRYVTTGHSYYVQKARNGITLGSGGNGSGSGYYVNDSPVNFRPIDLNDRGVVLGQNLQSQPFDWFLYDTATATKSFDLGLVSPINNRVGPFLVPGALNHHQIPAYMNGQPLLDSSGRQQMKEAPQLVGADYTFSSSVATIWEQDPASGRYEMNYLNRLVGAGSGWEIQDAYDINDDGVIACDGWYQATDGQGNAVGAREWHGCLLVPIRFEVRAARANEKEVFEPNIAFNPINHGFDPVVLSGESDGDAPHASVASNRTNDVVDLIVPEAFAPAIGIRVTAGAGALSVTPDAPSGARTNLALDGLDIGSDATDAVVEAQLKSNGATLAKLNVTVFPARTVPIEIYRVGDSHSTIPSLPPATPTDDAIINVLNDIFLQAGVHFTAVAVPNSSRDIRFDLDNNGKLTDDEDNHTEMDLIETAVGGSPSRLKLYLTGALGASEPQGLKVARGLTDDRRPDGYRRNCFVFKGIIPDDLVAALNAAHEIGHALDLSNEGPTAPHDDLPVPFETISTAGALMHTGHGSDQPGRWIRHNDWSTGWKTAIHQN